MDIITLRMKDYSTLQLIEAEPYIVQSLYDHFSFFVPGHKFMKAFKNTPWDGKIHLLNRTNGEINAGLYWAIKKFAMQRGLGVKVEDGPYGFPYDKNKVQHVSFMEFLESLDLPFKPYDYQYEGIVHAIENKRAVLLSPTGSGKSLIIYVLLRWYLEHFDKKILVIVPSTGLVEQMYNDFVDYGFDKEEMHRIYSGKDKNTSCRVVISTWQSIYKLPKIWFQQFGCVFGDEVHGFKAKSLSSIMEKSIKAEYRFGTTGTLDGTQVHRLVLEGLFGPVKRVTTTRELQEKGTLAQLNIDIILLEYPEEERKINLPTDKRINKRTYQQEIEFLVTNRRRNNFIANLTVDLKGNTLVLFNLVEKHGKVLKPLIESRLKDGQDLYFVSGETKTTDRDRVRGIVDSHSGGAIVLASLGTFSTGINIKNIHNIVFASPSKSQIRVLQSIGRGLRLSENNVATHLYDIADDLHIGKKRNFTLLHCGERVKIYNKEKFPNKVTKVNLYGK